MAAFTLIIGYRINISFYFTGFIKPYCAVAIIFNVIRYIYYTVDMDHTVVDDAILGMRFIGPQCAALQD